MQLYPGGEDPDFYRQAQSCLEAGSYDRSLELARVRLAAAPDDVRAALVLCRSWLGLGRLDEAAAAFAAIEPLNEEIARLLKLLGDAYRERGERRRAVTCYQRSMALLAGLAELQEVQNAVAALLDDEATDDGPAAGDGFQTLTMAELHIRQGHYESAREILTAILVREPENHEARQRLTEVLELWEQKNIDLPIDKKSMVVHELSRWLIKLGGERHDGG
ncbi:MAG TPA: tetratricopeptide repeat protein [Syntrophales bacterium]|mgnify:FL=1|nr:tetratricopeptide repeat protein [Syntrophales bacterium]